MSMIKTPPTNRELAEKLGVSQRTIIRYMNGHRRNDWWSEMRAKLRDEAARLRDTGLSWREVGEQLGVSEGAARAMGQRAKKAWAESGKKTA